MLSHCHLLPQVHHAAASGHPKKLAEVFEHPLAAFDLNGADCRDVQGRLPLLRAFEELLSYEKDYLANPRSYGKKRSRSPSKRVGGAGGGLAAAGLPKAQREALGGGLTAAAGASGATSKALGKLGGHAATELFGSDTLTVSEKSLDGAERIEAFEKVRSFVPFFVSSFLLPSF